MAKEESKVAFNKIMSELKSKQYAPIYFLMGEEPYFIDIISEYIENSILSEDEKDMNLRVLYGKDIKIEDVFMEARQFPFMAEKRVVIIKEAQNLKRNIDKIEQYLKSPVQSTILVFCYKYDKLDARKKYVKALETKGVIFHSKALYENQIPAWIANYCKENNLLITSEAANILKDHVGGNLLRLASEIDKLKILLNNTTNTITEEIIEKNVGISKDYNIFELTKALGQKNVALTFQIINYFDKEPKEFSIQNSMGAIFNYFLTLLSYQLLQDKSPNNVSIKLGINAFYVKDYATAGRFYSVEKIFKIMGYIRTTDAKSKGSGSVNASSGNLLKELCFRILNAD